MTVITPTRKAERQLWQAGHRIVVGVDEVGRGPLAGPLAAAAVVLPDRCRLGGVRDSKLMTAKQRQRAATAIKRTALGVGLGWAAAREIDELGLTAALGLAAERALTDLQLSPDVVILDGSFNYLDSRCNVNQIVKADQTCLAVAAASVVAKVARDNYMDLLHGVYPSYGFGSHKGYATTSHLELLRQFGPCPHHRRRFAPVSQAQLVFG